MRAKSRNFHRMAVSFEPLRGSRLGDCRIDLWVLEFERNATALANQELTLAAVAGVGATGVRVQRRKPMDQTITQQEFQRAIDRGGCRPSAILRKRFENFVRAERTMSLPHNL